MDQSKQIFSAFVGSRPSQIKTAPGCQRFFLGLKGEGGGKRKEEQTQELQGSANGWEQDFDHEGDYSADFRKAENSSEKIVLQS